MLNELNSAKSPISVKLKSPETKQDILRARNYLGDLPYMIESNLSKKLRNWQELLFPLMREFKSKGYHAIIQDAKLIVDSRVEMDANLENFQVVFEKFKATPMGIYQSRKLQAPANNAFHKYPWYQKSKRGKVDSYFNKNKMKNDGQRIINGDFSGPQYLYA